MGSPVEGHLEGLVPEVGLFCEEREIAEDEVQVRGTQ